VSTKLLWEPLKFGFSEVNNTTSGTIFGKFTASETWRFAKLADAQCRDQDTYIALLDELRILMQTVTNLQLLTDPHPHTIHEWGTYVSVIPRAYTDRSIYYNDINQDFPQTAAYHRLRNHIRYKYSQSDISDPTGAVCKLALPSSTLRGLLKDSTYDPSFVSHIKGPHKWIELCGTFH